MLFCWPLDAAISLPHVTPTGNCIPELCYRYQFPRTGRFRARLLAAVTHGSNFTYLKHQVRDAKEKLTHLENALSCIKRSLRLDHCRSVSSFQESSLLQVNGVKKQTLIPGLTENTRYFVRVVAVGCRGKSQPTKWAKAKTPVEGGSPRRRNADSSPKKKATAQPLQQPMGDGQSSQIGKYWHLYCKQQGFFFIMEHRLFQ